MDHSLHTVPQYIHVPVLANICSLCVTPCLVYNLSNLDLCQPQVPCFISHYSLRLGVFFLLLRKADVLPASALAYHSSQGLLHGTRLLIIQELA